jgi:hypothetical protein
MSSAYYIYSVWKQGGYYRVGRQGWYSVLINTELDAYANYNISCKFSQHCYQTATNYLRTSIAKQENIKAAVPPVKNSVQDIADTPYIKQLKYILFIPPLML